MKKILSGIVFAVFAVSMLLVSSVSANWDVSKPWQPPVWAQYLNFQASLQNWQVSMNWAQMNLPDWDSWKYYKVMRSQTKEFAVYPDDGYWKYIGSIGQTSIVDTDPPQGKTYYRVCAITQSSWGKHRYCSTPVTINNDWSSTTTNDDKNTTTTTTIALSDTMKTAIDRIIDNFATKLDVKYPDDITTQKNVVVSIVAQMDSIINTASAKNKPLFLYVKEKLEELEAVLSLQEILNLD